MPDIETPPIASPVAEDPAELARLTVERVHELYEAGATPIDATFSVAADGQGDVLYEGRRYLITPNDAAYREYVSSMRVAGWPHVANDNELGNDQVVVGEIPRDARVVPQFVRGKQPDTGMTSSDVFYLTGSMLGAVATDRKALPVADDLSVGRIMALRNNASVMLVPPVRFTEATPEARDAVVNRLGDELLTRYARFGGALLLDSLKEGLSHGSW